MKVYFVDKYGKYLSLMKRLENLNIENIEYKEDVKHRLYKTDYVITVDFNNEYDEYKKVNNLIIITNKTEKNEIWNMANKLNTKDIILITCNEDYIAERIKKIIKE